ncbi:HipA family kinase [Niallia sp. 03133]|uniref:HipA family kinase n=1 Tax=Niallia sp. 03133 TaxID=3458060 RepID=UPI004044A8FD
MIEPIAYQKKMDGKSNAYLITFSDGKDYVVKYIQPGFEKSLANEWIGYCIGRFLGLPIPFAKVVEIPSNFSMNLPEMKELDHSKYQFASLYEPNCLNGHQVSTITKITNSHTLAGIIVFDHWLYNRDRTKKNILLKKVNQDEYRLFIMDHAEIFNSYNWTLDDLNALNDEIMKSSTHELMAQFIDNQEVFTEQLKLIQSIPTHLLEEIVKNIPEDWNVSDEEKKTIVKSLVIRRKKILPQQISKMIKKVYKQ